PPRAAPPPHPRQAERKAAASRRWVSLTGPSRRRTTTVAFRLAHAGPLVFTLEELWPSCRRLSTFHARGRRGVNHIHFKARIGSKRVAPGTYRLVARRPSGRLVMQAKLVIVRGRK